MVSDRNRLVPPANCLLYDGFGVADSIHVAHLGMAMQLDTLNRAGIHASTAAALDRFDAFDGSNREFLIELVHDRIALDADMLSSCNQCQYIVLLLRCSKNLCGNGIRMIRYYKP